MTTDGRHLLNGGKLPLIAPDLLGEILATASDVALLVAPSRRVISVLVNPHHRSFGQLTDWEGAHLKDILTEESLRKVEARINEMHGARHGETAVELNHADQTNWEFPVRYSMHRIGADDSILMLGRDLRPIAEVQQQLVQAQLALERDYETQRELDTRYRVLMEVARDPVIMVSMSTGRISDINPAAAQLLGGQRSELVGAAIAQEFEGRRRGEFLESLANLAVTESSGPIELIARR
ncbi:MAG: transcriptional regulator PpsR, partial [Pseudomonadota bacterium]